MEKILQTIKSDLRIVLSVLLIVFLALKWFVFSTSSEGVGSASESYSGFTVINANAMVIMAYVIPLIFIVVFLLPALSKYRKAIYPIGSLVGIILTLACGFIVKDALATGVNAANAIAEAVGASVDSSYKFGIGLWLTIVDYVAIIVYSLIYDFKISKETLQSRGLKEIAKSVASDVVDSAAAMGKDISSGEMAKNIQANVSGIPCPQCGSTIALGKKFCKGCGYKVPDEMMMNASAPEIKESVGAQENVITSGNTSVQSGGVISETSQGKTGNVLMGTKNIIPSKRGNSANNTGNIHGIVCECCGLVSDYAKIFCADCGTKLKTQKYCSSCGAMIIGDKQFCADCGTPASARNICKKCGAEIWGRKLFCAECGEKVNYTKTCANCGAEVIQGKNFCPDCGKPYSAI